MYCDVTGLLGPAQDYDVTGPLDPAQTFSPPPPVGCNMFLLNTLPLFITTTTSHYVRHCFFLAHYPFSPPPPVSMHDSYAVYA